MFLQGLFVEISLQKKEVFSEKHAQRFVFTHFASIEIGMAYRTRTSLPF